jgi:hypothetical protein
MILAFSGNTPFPMRTPSTKDRAFGPVTFVYLVSLSGASILIGESKYLVLRKTRTKCGCDEVRAV